MKKSIKEILILAVIGLLIGIIPLSTSPFLLFWDIAPPGQKNAYAANFISLDFQDANLKDVLKIFSQQSGLNFVASETIKNKQVTLYLDNVSVQDALYNIIEANQLAYKQAEGSNIFMVTEKPAEQEVPTITKVYKLKFARLSTSILESSNAALSGTTISLSGGLSALGGASGGGGGGGGGGGVKGIDIVVEKLLSSRGSLAIDERTSSLIITDVPAQFERIEAAISQLDVRTSQIVIEAEILETTQGTIDKLGIEFGGSNGTIFSASGAGVSQPFPFASRARAIDATASTVSLGTLSFNDLTAVMQALSTKSDTKLLARPRIITLDNESAVINITSETAVASLTQTTTAEGTAVSTAETPERLTTGIILTVTPQINEDGYITMLVAPEVTEPVTSAFFSQFIDPQTRSTRNIVRVKDGDTIVIGGLLKEDVSKTLRKVPILGSIPILGIPFRKITETVTNKELIVFITPRIIKDEKAVKKEEVAMVVPPDKETEAASVIAEELKKEIIAQETPKETAPKEAIIPESREEAIERALDQLGQNHTRIRKDKTKPTDQI